MVEKTIKCWKWQTPKTSNYNIETTKIETKHQQQQVYNIFYASFESFKFIFIYFFWFFPFALRFFAILFEVHKEGMRMCVCVCSSDFALNKYRI